MRESERDMVRERIGGGIFDYDDNEPLDPEILAKAEAAFAEFEAREPQIRYADLPERFHDDLVGTEFEGWTPPETPEK